MAAKKYGSKKQSSLDLDNFDSAFDSDKIVDFTSAKSKAGTFKRCAHSHPPLDLGTFTIYGGSGNDPSMHDADIYIGFDYGMKRTNRALPWEAGTEFLYHIVDGSVPKDKASFDKLLAWVVEQGEAGKKIHVGCIGGHGRTGLVLAALVKLVMGEVDAIEYVRKNYCTKAVETSEQVQWLVKHYGIKAAEPSRKPYVSSFSAGGSSSKSHGPKTPYWQDAYKGNATPKGVTVITPMPYSNSIW